MKKSIKQKKRNIVVQKNDPHNLKEQINVQYTNNGKLYKIIILLLTITSLFYIIKTYKNILQKPAIKLVKYDYSINYWKTKPSGLTFYYYSYIEFTIKNIGEKTANEIEINLQNLHQFFSNWFIKYLPKNWNHEYSEQILSKINDYVFKEHITIRTYPIKNVQQYFSFNNQLLITIRKLVPDESCTFSIYLKGNDYKDPKQSPLAPEQWSILLNIKYSDAALDAKTLLPHIDYWDIDEGSEQYIEYQKKNWSFEIPKSQPRWIEDLEPEDFKF